MDMVLHFAHNAWAFILIISVIVFIHEFGHYWVARRCGVRVEEFSIGFGKEIWGRNDKHGTRWKVSILPFGGFVKMFGDADPSSSPDKDKLEHMSEEDKKVAFQYKSLPQKAAVVAAGPVANFALAIVILTGFFMAIGRPVTAPVAGEVLAGSAAEAAGVKAGDRFISIDGTPMVLFSDIQRITRLHQEGPMEVVIEREGKQQALQITPRIQESKDIFGNKVKIALLGVSSGVVSYEKLSPMQAVEASFVETYQMCVDTLKALGQMVMGTRSVKELGGPLKIAKYSGQSVDQGLTTVLWFMAVLSVNLGLVNLFPIPMLDGGHLMFYCIEALRGRPMAEKVQNYAFKFGFAILISLMAFTTINDVIQLF